MQERCQGRDCCLQAMAGSGDVEWTGPGLTPLFQAKTVMEKMVQDEESCVREPVGWRESSPGARHKEPCPAQPGSTGAAWEAQPGPSRGSRSCKLPMITSYHPIASTRLRQARDEGQSGMKKTKGETKERKRFIETNSVEGQNIKEKSCNAN